MSLDRAIVLLLDEPAPSAARLAVAGLETRLGRVLSGDELREVMRATNAFRSEIAAITAERDRGIVRPIEPDPDRDPTRPIEDTASIESSGDRPISTARSGAPIAPGPKKGRDKACARDRDQALVDEVWSDLSIRNFPDSPRTWLDSLREACAKRGVLVDDALRITRETVAARADHWIELIRAGYSYPRIGRTWRLDHTSILYLVKQHDPKLAEEHGTKYGTRRRAHAA